MLWQSSPFGENTVFVVGPAADTAERLFGGKRTSFLCGEKLRSSSWKPSSKVNSKITPTEKHAMAQACLKSVLLGVTAQKINS